jgi:hypothetical protein
MTRIIENQIQVTEPVPLLAFEKAKAQQCGAPGAICGGGETRSESETAICKTLPELATCFISSSRFGFAARRSSKSIPVIEIPAPAISFERCRFAAHGLTAVHGLLCLLALTRLRVDFSQIEVQYIAFRRHVDSILKGSNGIVDLIELQIQYTNRGRDPLCRRDGNQLRACR